MHIPDGLMAPLVAAAGWVAAIAALAFVTRALNKRVDDRHVPLMALLAAGIFVAQMLNFPVGGGTTGHLVGAALAAILLGPAAGMAVMMVILAIQALLFGDGGVTALGLNFLNMGVVGCLGGYYIFRAFPARHQKAGIFVASWMAVFLGAAACALELAASNLISGGEYGISAVIAFPTMTIFYAIIGIGEALITMGILAYLGHVAPDMLRMTKTASSTGAGDEEEVVPDA